MFSKKYSTFAKWRTAQRSDSSYAKQIERLHARYPNATLSQLRRHPGKKQSGLSALKAVKSSSRFGVMTMRERERYDRVLQAVYLMRNENISLSQAAKRAGTTPATVRQMAKGALKQEGRKWSVKSSDQLTRRLRFLDQYGEIPVVIQGSKQASLIASYHNAIRIYLEFGDASALKVFEGKTIKTMSGDVLPFITDTRLLDRLARTGQLRFESIYSIVGA